MILSACSSLDYNNFCGILRRTFGSFVSSSESSLIKSEVFYSKGDHRASRNGQLRRKNPKDKSGRVSKCAVCECPESDIFEQSEIVNTEVADQDNHCLHDVHELELPIVEEQSAARPDNITQDIE